MAELQKLIQCTSTESNELMKLYLSEAQHSFMEHSKKANKLGSSSSTLGSNNSNFLISNNSGGNNNNMNTMGNQQTMADINLNVRPPSSSGNLNISSTMAGTGGDLLNTNSPSSSLQQTPSPFLELGMAELSPLPGGINLNLGFDNMCLPTPGDNLNGNTGYSPSNRSQSDNIANSPMIMPNLDNLDPCSPSEFFTGNMTTTVEPGTSPRNANMNLNTMSPSSFISGASVCPPTNLNNLKISPDQMNVNSQQYPGMLSPNAIKKETTEPPYIKREIKSEPKDCVTPEPTDIFAAQNRLWDVDRVLAEAQMTPEESRLLLLNQVTDTIIEAHMLTTINTHANVDAAKERIAGHKLDPNDMIPDLSRLSLSASDLWQQFLTALVPEITKVVKFSKKLPAFSDFPQTDQIKLIKQGAFEVMMTRYSILVDEVNELMLDPKLEMISPRHVIGELPMGPFLDEFFTIAKHFNPLQLTDGEIGLFTAILMICPDREDLENREAISKIQDLILQALYLLMTQNTTRTESNPEATFRSLIGMIGQFRKVNDDHARFLNNIKMKSPSEFNQQFPALHQEVFEDSIKKSQHVE